MLAALLAWTLTVSTDMTPDEQAMVMRQVVDRDSCMTIRFSSYDLEACKGKRTNWLRLCDYPFYLDGEKVCWGNWH